MPHVSGLWRNSTLNDRRRGVLNVPFWIILFSCIGAATGALLGAYLSPWCLIPIAFGLVVFYIFSYYTGSWIITWGILFYYFPLLWTWLIMLILLGAI